MKAIQRGDTWKVSEIEELAAGSSALFTAEVTAALPCAVKQIEIDLAQTKRLDCGGVGALIALRNRAREHDSGVQVRLLNASPLIRQLLELTQVSHDFSTECA
jgi:ABC-type transporter Mla MlaB component